MLRFNPKVGKEKKVNQRYGESRVFRLAQQATKQEKRAKCIKTICYYCWKNLLRHNLRYTKSTGHDIVLVSKSNRQIVDQSSVNAVNNGSD